MKNRNRKTRRQSGGLAFGWNSFITADDNPPSGKRGKGIDVKVQLENGKPMWWLIGGNDKTFRELELGAKDRRYVDFIAALKIYFPSWENFTNPGRSSDSSKGIKLSHAQFCGLFINGPLDYPVLTSRFRDRGYECSSAQRAPSSAQRAPSSAQRAPSSAQRAPIELRAPTQGYAPSSVTTIYLRELQQIKNMNLENVTNQMIAQALNDAKGNADTAVEILVNASAAQRAPISAAQRAPISAAQRAPMNAAFRETTSAVVRPFARGGIIEAAPNQQKASIQDFLQAQNGTLPRVLGGGVCPTYDQALQEIKEGKKTGHWIWYIIPSSPGHSDTSKFFGIGPANVTPEQYLSNPTLSARYVEILTAIGAKLQQSNPSNVNNFFVELMGSEIDYEKLRDSLSTFYNVLVSQRKVNDQISSLAHQLGVQSPFIPPSGPPPPGPSAAPIPSLSPQIPSPFIPPPCDEYINFEHQISDTTEQPDKILKKTYNISVNDDTSLSIALKWADASQQCNAFYAPSFIDYAAKIEKQNYGDLVMKSLNMQVNAITLPIPTQKVANDGWCFYRAVLTAAKHKMMDVRKFAQAITYCVTHIFTNSEDAMKQKLTTLVNGIQSRITVEQLVKLVSIPNLTAKQNPCVYPELDQCIGQAAAYILQKNIIVYHPTGDVVGKYRGTDLTGPTDQIYLVNTNGNHFDIITAAP